MEKQLPETTVRGNSYDSPDCAADDALPSPKRTNPTAIRTDDWWIWETIGVIGSALAIIGIVVLLNRFDGQPQPDWAYANETTGKGFHISLNSVLSWLSTVARICALMPITKGLGQLKWVWFAEKDRVLSDFDAFDSATRGLTGSAMLMWRLKGRHFAAIGALAMILALGFDAFVQNLVTYSMGNRSQHDGSVVGNATVYNYAAADGTLHRRMKANIQAALFDYDTSYRRAEYLCKGTACIWEAYPTLSVCSRCADLRPLVTKNCSTEGFQANANGTASCLYSLPDAITTGPEGEKLSIGGLNVSLSPRLMAMETNNPPIVFTNYTDTLVTIHSISTFDTFLVNDTTPYMASECVLIPCVQSLTTRVNASEPQDDGDLTLSTFYDEQTLEVWDQYTRDPSLQEGAWLAPPANPERGITPGHAFNLGFSAYGAIGQYLGNLFSGHVFAVGDQTQGVGHGLEESSELGATAMEAIYGRDWVRCDPTWDPEGFGGRNMIDHNVCAIENVAMAMTKSIRDTVLNDFYFAGSAEQRSRLAQATTYYPVTVVNVTWGWIALPVLIWFLSALMFSGTVWKTRRAGIRTWRTNTLATVFLGLGHEDKEKVKDHGLTENGLLKQAKDLRLRLHVTDHEAKMVGS